ncbi:MAG: exodeoxyribonuclease VII large subunit [Candidatus Paceibacterota bacterium]
MAERNKEQKIYSVGEFLDTLNAALEKKIISIRGEITEYNYRGYAAYLTLKDPEEQALLRCYVPRRSLPREIKLEEGMEIVVTGHPHIHKVYNFALQVHSILLTGEGVLLKALEELKKKLSKEGLFDEEKKSDIPPFVQTIGLITSPGSDAERDVRTHLGEWGMRVRRLGVHVEGVRAVSEIVGALRWFNTHTPDTDVIILTRGGGSLESLQAFNSEKVARAIFSSKIPVVCGVGHERDISIADMVADLRVSTPTHAGRYISERWERSEEKLNEYMRVYADRVGSRLQLIEAEFDHFKEKYEHHLLRYIERVLERLRRLYRDIAAHLSRSFDSFRRLETVFAGNHTLLVRRLREMQRSLQGQEKQLVSSGVTALSTLKDRIDTFEDTLAVVNPELKLKQGYSIAFNADGKVIQSVGGVNKGDMLTTRLSDGEISSEVESIS